MFDGKKNPVDFKTNMEKAIGNLFNSKDPSVQKQLSEKMIGFDNINVLKSEIMNDFSEIFYKID